MPSHYHRHRRSRSRGCRSSLDCRGNFTCQSGRCAQPRRIGRGRNTMRRMRPSMGGGMNVRRGNGGQYPDNQWDDLYRKRSHKRRRKICKPIKGLPPPGWRCCFMPDQMISMANGTFKQIIDVDEGELVKVWDEKTNKVINSPVNEIMMANRADAFELHLENGKVLKPTGNHPFLSKTSDTISPAPISAGTPTIDMSEAKWTTIGGHKNNHAGGNGFLKTNDYVYDIEDGWVEIVDIIPIEGEHDTYNFVDMETGTIIADGIITHNSGASTK